MDDPDAPGGTFVHWVLYDLSRRPPAPYPKACSAVGDLARRQQAGPQRRGLIGYTGPCPPSGTHHYHFKLYALDTILDLASGADKAQLETAMDKHVLAYGELVGTYTR